jgi:glutamyl-tRNA reductase
MDYLCFGISHHTAKVAVRERVAFTDSEIEQALKKLNHLQERLILSTCNRTELYLATDANLSKTDLLKELEKLKGLTLVDDAPSFYFLRGSEVIEHLMTVGTGIDSMVLGEDQILTQLKNAMALAQGQEAVSKKLLPLFQKTLEIGKKARTETKINENSTSVPSVALELAKQVFPTLSGLRILIVGAGEMAELTLKILKNSADAKIFIANRTVSKAEELAEQFQGQVVAMDSLESILPEIDLVITSTSAPHYLITKETLKKCPMLKKILLFIDLSVPRDVDPALTKLENVFVYDVDDLQKIADRNRDKRKKEVSAVEKMISSAVLEFTENQKQRKAVPAIQMLRSYVEKIAHAETEKLLQKLNHLNEKEKTEVKTAIHQLTQKILHEPTLKLKKLAQDQVVEQVIQDVFVQNKENQ